MPGHLAFYITKKGYMSNSNENFSIKKKGGGHLLKSVGVYTYAKFLAALKTHEGALAINSM